MGIAGSPKLRRRRSADILTKRFALHCCYVVKLSKFVGTHSRCVRHGKYY